MVQIPLSISPDTGRKEKNNSCLRLIVLLGLCEGCYLHMAAILMRDPGFSVQLLCDLVIAVLIVLFTRLRLEAISETEQEKAAEKEKKKTIVED